MNATTQAGQHMAVMDEAHRYVEKHAKVLSQELLLFWDGQPIGYAMNTLKQQLTPVMGSKALALTERLISAHAVALAAHSD